MKKKEKRSLIAHIVSWLVFISVAVFCYVYPRYIATYDDFVHKAFAPLEFTFIFVMFGTLWMLVYLGFVVEYFD